MEFSINSLYICVDDMDRAIAFYENFFDKKVDERDEIYSVFVIGGFRMGLFAYRKKNEPHSYGNNCLPSISVGNLENLKVKLENAKIVFPLTKIGRNWVSEIEDSEGNHIEVTASAE